jgi:hypothetical protein
VIFNQSLGLAAALMDGPMHQLLLSALLFLYELYLARNDVELAREILAMAFRALTAPALQAQLPVSAFPAYQAVLFRLLQKANELSLAALPISARALLESVSDEWRQLLVLPPTPHQQADLAAAKAARANQKLTRLAGRALVELLFRGEMADYIAQLLAVLQQQIHEDNSERYACECQPY